MMNANGKRVQALFLHSFPIKPAKSEGVIEQLHNSKLLGNDPINTTFEVAMVVETD